MILKLIFSVLALLALYKPISSELISRELVLRNVERKIDVASQLVKINVKINFDNIGVTQQPIKSFIYVISASEKDNLAYITASSGGVELKISPSEVSGNSELLAFLIDFKTPLHKGKAVNVEVDTIFSSSLTPYPSKIHQGEKQLVLYAGNHYHLSPYDCQTQTTVISLISPNVISYSRLKPTSHVDSSIHYGPYENVKPFSHDTMKIHYENNSPFLTITKLNRLIELSHWGNIAIEETLDILHTGALLKGSFSRYDFQREHSSYSSIKAFKTVLPASARDVYYRDEIGNISTSNMKILDDSVELDLRPRFPLFGGWKTHYTIGYNVPSYENLYYSGNKYILKIRVLDHVFDDMVVEDLNVKIILPEGVKNIKIRTPYDVKRLADDVHYTYLDTFGRPVLQFNKRNLVESHIQEMEIEYTFPSYMMLQEPLLIVGAFCLLFFVVILYVRLDLTLNKDETTEAKMRVSSHCEMVHCHQDKRASLYERIEEEIQKLKTSKDISHSQLATKKIFGAVRDETVVIHDLSIKIKVDNPNYADKIEELQKYDKILCDCLQQQLTNAEKLVGGKMGKQPYMDSNATINKKKETAFDKVKSTLDTI